MKLRKRPKHFDKLSPERQHAYIEQEKVVIRAMEKVEKAREVYSRALTVLDEAGKMRSVHRDAVKQLRLSIGKIVYDNWGLNSHRCNRAQVKKALIKAGLPVRSYPTQNACLRLYARSIGEFTPYGLLPLHDDEIPRIGIGDVFCRGFRYQDCRVVDMIRKRYRHKVEYHLQALTLKSLRYIELVADNDDMKSWTVVRKHEGERIPIRDMPPSEKIVEECAVAMASMRMQIDA